MGAIIGFVTLATLAAFGVLTWWAYEQGYKRGWQERSNQYLTEATMRRIDREPGRYIVDWDQR